MASRYHLSLVAIAALALFGSAARAGVPSPFVSTAPSHIVGSPDGTFLATVLVRDIALNPVIGSRVEISFANCAHFNPCPSPCTDCTIDPVAQSVGLFTDAAGVAVFNLRVGGSVCPAGAGVLRVYADGVLLGSPTFASLDQDGNLTVTLADVAQVQALVGSTDVRADFDGNGLVDAIDVGIVQAHVGVSCATPTPVRKGTWGALKGIYR